MRSIALLTVALTLSTATIAFADGTPQTLNSQYQNMKGGNGQAKPAPAGQQAPSSVSTQEWKSTAASTPMNAPNNTPATPVNAAPQQGNAPQGIDSVGNGAIPALPLDVQSSNNVTYINGGIGDEEKAEIKAKDKDFNLHVLLSAPHGEFISDVKARILDSKGTALISVENAGPYLYAHLQPGSYVLETTVPSETGVKKKKFTIGKGTVKEHVVYNQ